MLPYRVYLPQELQAMSSLTPSTTADPARRQDDDRAGGGPKTSGGLRALAAALSRLVGRGRLRRPAPGTI
jgi:hypothetical protein